MIYFKLLVAATIVLCFLVLRGSSGSESPTQYFHEYCAIPSLHVHKQLNNSANSVYGVFSQYLEDLFIYSFNDRSRSDNFPLDTISIDICISNRPHFNFCKDNISDCLAVISWDRLCMLHRNLSISTQKLIPLYSGETSSVGFAHVHVRPSYDINPSFSLYQRYVVSSTNFGDNPDVIWWNPTFSLVIVENIPNHSRLDESSIADLSNKFELLKTASEFGIVLPIVTRSLISTMQQDIIAVGHGVEAMQLHVGCEICTFWWWMFTGYLESIWNTDGAASVARDDFILNISESIRFIYRNKLLIAITTIVMILHGIFDLLAMKTELDFWSRSDENAPLRRMSDRGLIVGAISQIIIALSLFDSSAHPVFKAGAMLRVAVEIWKILQKYNTRKAILEKNRPSVVIELCDVDRYDRIATYNMYFALAPLILGIVMHCLLQSAHDFPTSSMRVIYSLLLQFLVSIVYTWSFAAMFPQLYINYKLQSVAHIPWMNLAFRFLNTIIDDLFSFLFPLPWLHRIACFRDDIIFVGYIFQLYLYRCDYARIQNDSE